MIASSLSPRGRFGKPPCTDLHERFGDRYKIEHAESYAAERPEFRSQEEVWLQIIPCRFGHVYPYGGSALAVFVDGHPKLAGRLKRQGCCRVYCDGDDGTTLLFDVADFDKVAEIMRPKKRRRMTPEQRQAAVERLKAFQFLPHVTAS